MTPPQPHRRLTILVAAAGLVVPTAIVGSAPVAGAEPDTAVDSSPQVEQTTSTTLITGDRLTVNTLSDGRLAIDVEAAVRSSGVAPTFHQMELAGDTYVVPSDAQGLIAEGRVDRELFNVDELMRTDADGVPGLLVMKPSAARHGTNAGPLVAIDEVTALPSINGAAFRLEPEDAADFWDELTTPKMGTLQLDPMVSTVWLDRMVEVQLEESVQAINAPAAWEAGLDGTGTKVAVLDTGWDPDHPDLVGQVVASAGFTDESTAVDGHGHGTHVAATVAGTGAGSDGSRPGVAPGAQLLIGKVLDDDGFGPTSGIIQGMEWAVGSGADVVNMSLGSVPTDGTDPMSLAVDNLTESSGALFVIAAGNDGRDYYVNSPGAATRALTVGAVSNEGQLAWFSSRGPRVGDHAIKPEITAPGENITAARASGTSMGSPVDELYTSASGTSMATPHVAGAAALAIQRMPDASADEIKGLLVSTAVPTEGLTVYQQGGGMVDASQVATGDLSATPSPLNLGYFTYPYDDVTPVTESVTLHNHSEQDIDLELSLEVTAASGAPVPSEMVTLEDEAISVPAGESVTTGITVDTSVGDYSLYSGQVVGRTGGEVVVRVPLGFYKEDERFTLEVSGLARDGDAASGTSFADVVNVEDVETFASMGTEFHNGVMRLRVPRGVYSVTAGIYSYDEASETPSGPKDFSFVAFPEVEVNEDVALVADAATANPLNVDIRTHDVDYGADGAPSIYSQVMRSDAAGIVTSHSVGAAIMPMYAASTDPVELGAFEYNSRHILVDPEEQFSGDVLFDAVFVEEGRIPDDLNYAVTQPSLRTDFARNRNSFHGNEDGVIYAESRHHWRPHETASVSFGRYSTGPHTRTDYVSAGDSRWSLYLEQAQEDLGPGNAQIFSPTVKYSGGEENQISWYEGPFHPTIRDGVYATPSLPSVRNGDELNLTIYGLSDAQLGHSGLTVWFKGLETQFRLFEDGEQIGEGIRPRGRFPVSEGEHELRLEFETHSPDTEDWGLRSSQVKTAWTVQSKGGSPEVLPLLFVDYDVPLTLFNRLESPGRTWVDLGIRHQAGAAEAPLESVEVWFSHDAGETWEEAGRVQHRTDGKVRAQYVPPRTGSSDVSIKVVATDTAGNAVEQQVIDAFGRPH